MAGQLPGLSRTRRPSPKRRRAVGQDRQRRRLRTWKRALGDQIGTTKKPTPLQAERATEDRLRIVDRTGGRCGHLIVIARAPNQGRRVMWRCQCVCGSVFAVAATNLRPEHTASCGCKGRGTPIERFLAKVDSSNLEGCWLWTGAVAGQYGTFQCDGVQMPAHRAALILLRKAVLPTGHGMHVDHLCGNKLCVNPNHLELVTAAENIRRRDQSRRAASAMENVCG